MQFLAGISQRRHTFNPTPVRMRPGMEIMTLGHVLLIELRSAPFSIVYWDSSVGPGIESPREGGEIFRTCPSRLWGPIQLSVQNVPGFPRGKTA